MQGMGCLLCRNINRMSGGDLHELHKGRIVERFAIFQLQLIKIVVIPLDYAFVELGLWIARLDDSGLRVWMTT